MDKPEEKPPIWYTELEITQAIAMGNFVNQNEGLHAAIARHLQLAFEKGFSMGLRRSTGK